ncbi:MAG: transposase, partial [Sphingomonadaceae bacterium]
TIDAFLGDKGYDADAIREELEKADVEAVIPAKSNRIDPAPHDPEKYKWRNHVERLFNRLKNWRRIATRYDKTKDSYLGFVCMVAALMRIPFDHEA